MAGTLDFWHLDRGLESRARTKWVERRSLNLVFRCQMASEQMLTYSSQITGKWAIPLITWKSQHYSNPWKLLLLSLFLQLALALLLALACPALGRPGARSLHAGDRNGFGTTDFQLEQRVQLKNLVLNNFRPFFWIYEGWYGYKPTTRVIEISNQGRVGNYRIFSWSRVRLRKSSVEQS